jgi:hypothetical protein
MTASISGLGLCRRPTPKLQVGVVFAGFAGRDQPVSCQLDVGFFRQSLAHTCRSPGGGQGANSSHAGAYRTLPMAAAATVTGCTLTCALPRVGLKELLPVQGGHDGEGWAQRMKRTITYLLASAALTSCGGNSDSVYLMRHPRVPGENPAIAAQVGNIDRPGFDGFSDARAIDLCNAMAKRMNGKSVENDNWNEPDYYCTVGRPV